MKTRLFRLMLSLMLLSLFPFTIRAEENMVPASLTVLVEESTAKDGQSFLIQGELVGEPLFEPAGVWLNILEEGNPMAVFCPASLASMAGRLTGGNHQRQGDYIRVKGVLRRICPDHGGDLDFHASTLDLLCASRETPEIPKKEELIILVSIVMTTLVVAIRTRTQPEEPHGGNKYGNHSHIDH